MTLQLLESILDRLEALEKTVSTLKRRKGKKRK